MRKRADSVGATAARAREALKAIERLNHGDAVGADGPREDEAVCLQPTFRAFCAFCSFCTFSRSTRSLHRTLAPTHTHSRTERSIYLSSPVHPDSHPHSRSYPYSHTRLRARTHAQTGTLSRRIIKRTIKRTGDIRSRRPLHLQHAKDPQGLHSLGQRSLLCAGACEDLRSACRERYSRRGGDCVGQDCRGHRDDKTCGEHGTGELGVAQDEWVIYCVQAARSRGVWVLCRITLTSPAVNILYYPL